MACPTGTLKVESKDPRVNYNLLPGEELRTCPYNFSHGVLPIKFNKHILNCYRLHCKDQEAKGAKPLFSICQYDRSHHVRNEELAYHESICTAKLGRDDGNWGWDNDDDQGNSSSATNSGDTGNKATAAMKVAPLKEPPPIDPEAIKVLQAGEEWEEESTGIRFNADHQIHLARMKGYNVVKAQSVIGMTKSEKKKFYESEKETLKKYEQAHAMQQLSLAGIAGAPSSTLSSSCASAYGMDDRLDPIAEDF